MLPAFFVPGASLPAEDRPVLRIGGSDLLGAAFQEALEEFARDYDLDLKIELRGTFAARTALEDGSLDLALIAAPRETNAGPEGFDSHVFAYQTAVLAINSSNPLNELNLPQVAGIYGAEEITSFTRWGDLGLSGDLRPRSIGLHSIDVGSSIAVDLLRHEVLRTPRLRGTVAFHRTPAEVIAAVEDSVAAMGLLPQSPPPGSPVRVLALSQEEGGIAFGPSGENVHSGDYPIRLPIYLVFSPESREPLRDLLLFLTRERVAEAIEEAGLLPLPSSARNRQRLEFERF